MALATCLTPPAPRTMPLQGEVQVRLRSGAMRNFTAASGALGPGMGQLRGRASYGAGAGLLFLTTARNPCLRPF